MPAGFFVTGTDTGVGKTVIAAALIRAFQARGIRAGGMKPVETGCVRSGSELHPPDGMFLKKAARMEESIHMVTPYCFETPAAPSLASEAEGRLIKIGVIRDSFEILAGIYDAMVVEGAGGILVPLTRDYCVADLIRELGLPVIVVARPSLGTLNHTLLTVRYAMSEGIPVSGIILNFCRPPDGSVAEATNPRLLGEISPVPVIGLFPHLGRLGDEVLEKTAARNLAMDMLVEKIRQAGHAKRVSG